MEEARDANPVRLNVGLGFDATNDLVEELEMVAEQLLAQDGQVIEVFAFVNGS